jgi:hypothetical protein
LIRANLEDCRLAVPAGRESCRENAGEKKRICTGWRRLAARGDFVSAELLISGSKVGALVRPPSKLFAPPSTDGAAALLRRFDLTLLSLRARAQKKRAGGRSSPARS